MSKKKTFEPDERPHLQRGWTKEDAQSQLMAGIERGRALQRQSGVGVSLDQFEAEASKWHDYNFEMLRAMFTTLELANDYSYATPSWMRSPYTTAAERYRRTQVSIERQVTNLESVIERLPWFEIASTSSPQAAESTPAPRYRDIHIHIESSTVGQLNLGQVIGSIETHLKAVIGPSAEDLSRAVTALVEAIAADKKLTDNAKREAIENVDLLASAAAELPEKRTLGPVKAVLAATASLLASGNSAITIWQAAERLFRAHFGI
jgi:hypothetical protein